MEASLKEFLETWEKRKSGILPPVDLRVTCSLCGCEIMGDAKVEFGRSGLLCESCFKKEEMIYEG